MVRRNKIKRQPSSVSQAYSILGGYQTGDIRRAEEFLNSMPETEKVLRNRAEQKERTKTKMFSKKSRYPSLLKRAKQKGLGNYG